MAGDISVLVNRQLKKIVDDAVGSSETAIAEFAKTTYKDIVGRSPAITHYYKSNHRISIVGPKGGGQPKAKLFPPIKDSEEPGIFAGNTAATTAEELAKLADFRLGDSIRISTSVPYADSVEVKHGVYSGANAIAGAVLRRLKV